MRIGNWEIKEDGGRCYILSEYEIAKKGENKGEEYLANQYYPATFEKALIKIRKCKSVNSDTIDGYIEKMKEENDNFLKELKNILSKHAK